MKKPKRKELSLLFFNNALHHNDQLAYSVCADWLVQKQSRYTDLHHHIQADKKFWFKGASVWSEQCPETFCTHFFYLSWTICTFPCIETIILCFLLFLFCEKNVVRRHFLHSVISVNKVIRYMSALSHVIKNKSKTKLPARFAVVFDRRSSWDAH